MHLDDERLERLLHGEIEAAGESVRDHLIGCTECQERLAAAKLERNEVFSLLGQVDHRAPAVHPSAVAARAQSGRSRLWAASILLFLGIAGAAYALPGSPVRGWLRSVTPWIAGTDPQAISTPSGNGPAAGMAAKPGPDFLILFKYPDHESGVLVSFTDGPEVIVRAPAGVAGFSSAPDRLIVDNNAAGTFEIEIPRTASRVEIQVAGKPIFVKDGKGVTTSVPPGSDQAYSIPLSGPVK